MMVVLVMVAVVNRQKWLRPVRKWSDADVKESKLSKKAKEKRKNASVGGNVSESGDGSAVNCQLLKSVLRFAWI